MNEAGQARAPEGVALYAEGRNPPGDRPASYREVFSLIGALVVGQCVLVVAFLLIRRFGAAVERNRRRRSGG